MWGYTTMQPLNPEEAADANEGGETGEGGKRESPATSSHIPKQKKQM